MSQLYSIQYHSRHLFIHIHGFSQTEVPFEDWIVVISSTQQWINLPIKCDEFMLQKYMLAQPVVLLKAKHFLK